MSVFKSIAATAKKRGRKSQHYTTSWDEPIYGLARRPSDGRWRIIGTDVTFSEPDERLAVSRFRHWKAQQEPPRAAAIPVATATMGLGLREALEASKRPGHKLMIVPTTKMTPAGNIVSEFDITRIVPEAELWRWVRQQLLTRAAYAAEKSGVEWLAWGPELKRPAESATLEEVG